MSRPSLLRLAGTILLAASFFVFALGIASGFHGLIAVAAFLTVIFVLMLYFGICLTNKGDEEMDCIWADIHKEELASAVELIRLYADKYHDKDAEYAKEHIEALDDIIKNEDYHIQRALERDKQRIDTEDMIISIAKKIAKKIAEKIKGRYNDGKQ